MRPRDDAAHSRRPRSRFESAKHLRQSQRKNQTITTAYCCVFSIRPATLLLRIQHPAQLGATPSDLRVGRISDASAFFRGAALPPRRRLIPLVNPPRRRTRTLRRRWLSECRRQSGQRQPKGPALARGKRQSQGRGTSTNNAHVRRFLGSPRGLRTAAPRGAFLRWLSRTLPSVSGYRRPSTAGISWLPLDISKMYFTWFQGRLFVPLDEDETLRPWARLSGALEPEHDWGRSVLGWPFSTT